MSAPRSRVTNHLKSIRAGAIFAGACVVTPSVVACDPLPPPPNVTPSTEPSVATMHGGSVIEARLFAPQGDWKIVDVEVENAKMLSHTGTAPLALELKRSTAKTGETAVEGGDEPILVRVHYRDPTGAVVVMAYEIPMAGDADQGTEAAVSAHPER